MELRGGWTVFMERISLEGKEKLQLHRLMARKRNDDHDHHHHQTICHHSASDTNMTTMYVHIEILF